jgi:hypothetical protein
MLNEFVSEAVATETEIAEVTPVEPQLVLLSDVELAHVGGGNLANSY